MHFERRSQPLISRRRFVGRMFRSLLITLGIAVVSLALGTVGYCYFGQLAFLDGLLNASMILTGMGPVDPMKTDGGKLFASFYALYSGIAFLSIMAVITALVAPLLFNQLHIDPAAAQSIRAGVAPVERPEMPGFSSWLISLVPTNPIKAAADGAMLPLVLFTLAFGLALGRLAPDVKQPVVNFFRGIAEAMTLLVGWILALAPVGVFALALAVATKLGTSVVGAVAFYIAVHSGLLLVSVVVLYLAIVLAGVPLVRFARAALPGQLVAVTTRSSIAALPVLITSAEETLRLPRALTSFTLPLATATLRYNSAVSWVVVALFSAKLYGLTLGMPQIATIAVSSVLMSFSVPGIPSASLFVIAPFLIGVGIPAEAIGVLIAVDLVPDVFKTLANVTAHLASVTLLARTEAKRGTEPEAVTVETTGV